MALGEVSGISKVMIAQWETGKRKPGVDSLYTLSKALDVSFEWLAIGEGHQVVNSSNGPRFRNDPSAAPRYNSNLLKACAGMVLEVLKGHNLMDQIGQLPDLVEDLYRRSVDQGLDGMDRSVEGFKVALKDLVTIKVQMS